jgi:hypothetical protein
MKKCILVVQTNPLPGREDEYNDWYTNRHLQDVLKVPGFKSAQRFELAQPDERAKWRYLAIYEFESEAPEGVVDDVLRKVAGTSAMPLSDGMDVQSVSSVPWVAISNKLTNKDM